MPRSTEADATAPPLPLLITPAEAARRLGLDLVVRHPDRVVREMARKGQLRAVPVGRFTMIDPESVSRWAAGRVER